MTPLGQAEWVKFVGLLVGQEQKANETFDAIAARYNELKELTAEGKVKKRPVVLSGEMRGGNWYAVGGRAFSPNFSRTPVLTISSKTTNVREV